MATGDGGLLVLGGGSGGLVVSLVPGRLGGLRSSPPSSPPESGLCRPFCSILQACNNWWPASLLILGLRYCYSGTNLYKSSSVSQRGVVESAMVKGRERPSTSKSNTPLPSSSCRPMEVVDSHDSFQ